MRDAVVDRAIAGVGTREADWSTSASLRSVGPCDPAAMARAHRTIHIVSPHPDDEVLALGGLLARLQGLGASLSIVAVTDGGASHPGSTRWTAARLEDIRPIETRRALAALGIDAPVRRLRVPDGGVAAHLQDVVDDLVDHCEAGDLLVAPWRLDGHPDHEACARAAIEASELARASLAEYPVWAWHWATPDEPAIPWRRARRIDLDPSTVLRKRAAIGEFTSQLEPDGPRPPVLPPHVVARFARPFELIFCA